MIIDNMEIFVNRGRSEDITNGSSIVKQYIMQQTKDKSRSLANPIKKLVSKQKNRFDLDGFNLDLTYITNQIIAMGFPADDYESLFRNSMQDVQRFFNQRHKDHYKIINLCSERKYDHSNFNGMVSEYPFDDHQAPTFALIYGMCEDLDKWLNKDPNNVAGIHCKAGKGRTGIMICCFLLYCRLFKNSYEAMKYYGYMRTKNHKGVTIPSQIRYVFYFEKALNNNLSLQDIPQTQLYLHRLRLVTIPKADKLWIQVWSNDEITTFEDSTKQDDFIDFRLLNTKVSGDVRVMCFSKSLMTKKKKVFQFWFNTAFVQELLIIDKPMLDGAVKDKKNKIFSNNFRIELTSI